jgi:hypothetical protein
MIRNLESVLGPAVGFVARTGSLPLTFTVRRGNQTVVMSWPELWRECPRWRDVVVDWGSDNQRAEASLLGLYHPATREEALDSWHCWAEINRRIGFQGGEPDSRIYGGWSLVCHLQAYRWSKQTIDNPLISLKGTFLSDWLSLWWTRRKLALWDSPVGPWSLHPGSRSGGHGVLQTPMDYADSLAGLGSTQWVWRSGQSALGRKYGSNKYWRRGDGEMWCVPAFESLRREIWETATGARNQTITDREPRFTAEQDPVSAMLWPCLNQVNYLRTTQGLACWCESPAAGEDAVVNPNTSGIAAMGWEEGIELPWALPPGGGGRVRQRRVVEECRHIAADRPSGALAHNTTVGGTEWPASIKHLPPGEILSWVRHTENGLEVVQ